MGSSIQEREAELAALQAAFDEYITSSRELEEELDAELAKMRKLLEISWFHLHFISFHSIPFHLWKLTFMENFTLVFFIPWHDMTDGME